MNIDDINALCAEIAEETLTEAVNDYCDMLDEEWIAMMEASFPRYHGPDIDCEF